MSGSSQPSTQVVTQSIDPAMQPYIAYGLSEAQKLYQNTGTPGFYPGQTYVSPSASTSQALQLTANRAMQGNPLLPQAQQTVGGLQQAVNPALAGYQNLYQNAPSDPSRGFYSQVQAGQMQNPALSGYQSMLGAAGNDPSRGFYGAMQAGQFQNAAMPMTEQTAAGAYLGGNPFFSGAFDAAARAASTQFQDQMQQVSSQASRAGRYGSGAMGNLQDRAAGQFAQSLTDTAGKLAYQNYGAERAMQEAAMGRVGALSQQDIANRLTGAQGLSGSAQQQFANQMAAIGGIGQLSQQDLANRMAGAQGLTSGTQQQFANQLAALGGMGSTAASDFGRQLSAAQVAPGLAEADYSDIQKLYGVGQAQETYDQAALADAMQRFNFQQNLPAAKLQSFLSAAYGAPMGQQTTQPIYRNQMANILGGASLGGFLGGSQYGTLGAGIGAGAGLLGLLG